MTTRPGQTGRCVVNRCCCYVEAGRLVCAAWRTGSPRLLSDDEPPAKTVTGHCPGECASHAAAFIRDRELLVRPAIATREERRQISAVRALMVVT